MKAHLFVASRWSLVLVAASVVWLVRSRFASERSAAPPPPPPPPLLAEPADTCPFGELQRICHFSYRCSSADGAEECSLTEPDCPDGRCRAMAGYLELVLSPDVVIAGTPMPLRCHAGEWPCSEDIWEADPAPWRVDVSTGWFAERDAGLAEVTGFSVARMCRP
jgi:hypothetical protein